MELLSAVIITGNEERNIVRCLESLKGVADEIVVVDAFSTDNTPSICRQYGVTFIQHSWEGYSASKNFGNGQALHDWILSIDADEALSEELRTSILNEKKSPRGFFFVMYRFNNYCGKWMHFGGWRRALKLRMFDRRIASWKGEVHEHLEISQPVKIFKLKGDLEHYTYDSISDHREKNERYSTMAAEEMLKRGKNVSGTSIQLRTAFTFLQSYLFKLGFLDGAAGFTVAKMEAGYTRMKYEKLVKLRKSAVGS